MIEKNREVRSQKSEVRSQKQGRRKPGVRFLSSVFCLLSSVFLIFFTANSQSPDSWPQFRGNYNLTGIAQSQLPTDLKQLWSYDAGDIIESSAAIVDGIVYVGTGKSQLIALELSSGKLKWAYTTTDAVGESSPAVGGGIVF